jgi:hypothetical protein
MNRVFYVALIIPKEKAALAQKVLIVDSVRPHASSNSHWR